MQVGVFHPGVQHSRQTALALQQLGRLAFLATGLFDHPGSAMQRIASALPARIALPLRRELARFAYDGLNPALVRTGPIYELPERIAARLGRGGLAAWLDARGNAAFGRRIARIAQRDGPLVLWGYDAAAWSAFTDPRAADCTKILDRTMADGRSWNAQRALLRETQPEWFTSGSPAWTAQRIAQDDAEYAAADRILCATPFVAETILTHSPVEGLADKLTLLPYGYDTALFDGGNPANDPAPHEPVRFLFVGQVAARKGIRHVLEALARFTPCEAVLTVVGSIALAEHLIAPYQDRVTFTGPIPRTQVPAVMRAHHALVFPSYNEGSGIVMLEAMASGLTVIQASGFGPSEKSGFLLPEPDTDRVEAAMRSLVDDRERLHAMRQAALSEARHHGPDAYRENIARLLGDMGL